MTLVRAVVLARELTPDGGAVGHHAVRVRP